MRQTPLGGSEFAGVVRGFDVFLVEERPEPLAELQQFLAGARGLGMTTAQAAEQSRSMSARTGGKHTFQTGVGEELIAIPMPLLEQQPRLFQQVSPTKIQSS